jgi:hypothetical protein
MLEEEPIPLDTLFCEIWSDDEVQAINLAFKLRQSQGKMCKRMQEVKEFTEMALPYT